MTARNVWYDFGPILSLNAVLNFIPGGRGIGKTYGAQKLVIRDAIRNGDEFVYVRRYTEALKASKKTFFAAVESEFPDYDFRVDGSFAQMATVASRDDKKRDWTTIGHFMALSTAQQQKSVAFPKVRTIIFDEFIEESPVPGYLKSEYIVFLNLYSTIARKRENVRVLMLANAVSMMNPYFIALKIEPDKLPELSKSHKHPVTGLPFVAVHLPDSDKYKQAMYETRFGAFIQDTDYAAYAVENKFEDAHVSLVAKKTANARHEFNLTTKSGEFAVWYDRRQRIYYILDKLPKESKLNYTLEMSKMKEGKVGVTFTHPFMSDLRTAFRRARVMFESPKARNAFAEVFNK